MDSKAALLGATPNQTPLALIAFLRDATTRGEAALREAGDLAQTLEEVSLLADLREMSRLAVSGNATKLTSFMDVVQACRTIGVQEPEEEEASLLAGQFEALIALCDLVPLAQSQEQYRILLRLSAALSRSTINSELGNEAYSILISLQDLADVPEWGADQLASSRESLTKQYNKLLYPESEPDQERELRGTYHAPWAIRIVDTPEEQRPQVFLEYNQYLSSLYEDGTIPAMALFRLLRHFVDYPTVMAEARLHDLLRSILALPKPAGRRARPEDELAREWCVCVKATSLN